MTSMSTTLAPGKEEAEGLRLSLVRLPDEKAALDGRDAAHVDEADGAAWQGLSASRTGLAALG